MSGKDAGKLYALFRKYAKARMNAGNDDKLHFCLDTDGTGWILEEYADSVMEWSTTDEGIRKLTDGINKYAY